jgi:hypothetical protein
MAALPEGFDCMGRSVFTAEAAFLGGNIDCFFSSVTD